jgi:hypothetical protein
MPLLLSLLLLRLLLPGLFFPELAKLTAEFLPKVEAAYYIHNFKGTRPGEENTLATCCAAWFDASCAAACLCYHTYAFCGFFVAPGSCRTT